MFLLTKKTRTSPIGKSSGGASFNDIFKEEDVKEAWLCDIEEDNKDLHNFLTGVKNIGHKSNFCYLCYMAIRLIEMHRILKDTGSLYLHCDPTMSHYLKIILDCILGEENFINEIAWYIRSIELLLIPLIIIRLSFVKIVRFFILQFAIIP